jgi:penicillin-binding protein 2
MNFDTRRYVIYAFIIVVGFIYIIRLFYMQVIDDSWALRAQQIAEKRKEITPPRGSVYDRKGKKIVSNRTYYNLMMRESDMVAFDTSAFAKLIGWEKEEVIKR